jgi:hypothetical protein
MLTRSAAHVPVFEEDHPRVKVSMSLLRKLRRKLEEFCREEQFAPRKSITGACQSPQNRPRIAAAGRNGETLAQFWVGEAGPADFLEEPGEEAESDADPE